MASSLSNVAAGLADDSRFLAGWIGPDEGFVQQRLALDDERFAKLLLARTPRRSSFVEDVTAVADELNLVPASLASVLREVTAISALRKQPDGNPVGLLVAARDAGSESPRWRTSPHVMVAVEDFWSGLPSEWRSASNLEHVVALAAPVAVVSLPRLSVSRAQDWLVRRGARLGPPVLDRELRAMLVSWRGSSLVFVDGGLGAEDRRVSIAHEIGHLWLDYVVQRRQLLRKAPHLLAVVDGHRQLTAEDRAKAALEGAPLGVQTHMLARASGGVGSLHVEAAEQRAAEFALELIAPEAKVRDLVTRGVSDQLDYEASLRLAAELVRQEFGLSEQQAELRARGAFDSLRKKPGFFER